MATINPEKFYKPTETAGILGTTIGTLQTWRSTKAKGLPYYTFNGIRYKGSDILDYIESTRVSVPDLPEKDYI